MRAAAGHRLERTHELRPVRLPRDVVARVERRIRLSLKKALYEPLLRALLLPKGTIRNAAPRSVVIAALEDGTLTYRAGYFRGEFTAGIIIELKAWGAVWHAGRKSFALAAAKLPPPFRAAINVAQSTFLDRMRAVDKKLARLVPEEIAERVEVADLFDTALFRVERDLSKILSAITVTPELSPEQRRRLAAEWQDNVELSIRDFTEAEIKTLRQDVMHSALAGNRMETLVKSIRRSYGVTAQKAKFLARQETNLLLAKHAEVRFVAAGVHEYRWSCVNMPHDKDPRHHTPGNVRYSHGLLSGQIFRFDDPPVTSAPGQPMRRRNPGEDYNCRCVAVPVVRFK